MGWLGKLVGLIVLPAQKRSNVEYPLHANPTQEDMDALPGCYYWVNSCDSQLIRKVEYVGLIKFDGQVDAITLQYPINIEKINNTSKARANFVRTNDGLYYVRSCKTPWECIDLNLDTASLMQFDLEMTPNNLRLLSSNEVSTIKKKYCSALELKLNDVDVRISLDEIKIFKKIDNVILVNQIDFDLIHLQKLGYEVSRYSVSTNDGAKLDTVRIKLNTLSDSRKERYIVNFCGNNGSCFDMLIDKRMDADAGYTVIGFNYRGVLGSGGDGYQAESKQNLIDDGIAQVQTLLDEGVDPLDINLSGISLGGAIVLEVAAHFQIKDISIRALSDRTFASIQIFINTYTMIIANELLNPFSKSFYRAQPLIILAKSICWSLSLVAIGIGYLIVSAALQISNWNLNPAMAVKNIPNQHREYFVAKTPKSIGLTISDEHVDDQVIPYAASLYKHPFLQQERRKQKQEDNHSKASGSQINKYRKFYADNMQETHNTPLSNLKNASGDTAFEARMHFFDLNISNDDNSFNLNIL